MISAEVYAGGSVRETLAATRTLSIRGEQFAFFNGTGSGFVVKLPDARKLKPGADTFVIGAFTTVLTVQDNGGGAVETVGIDKVRRFDLVDNMTAAGTWIAGPQVPVALGAAV